MKTTQPELLKKTAVIAAVAVLLVAGSAFLGRSLPKDSVLERQASSIIATCEKDPYPAACYDIEVPKLMNEGFSMTDAFSVTKIIQKNTNSYWYCHLLAHKLAQDEVAKDPSQWSAVVADCPVNMCSNGCLHGAFQERFRNERVEGPALDKLVGELSGVCFGAADRPFTGVEKGSCYHGLGHLMMYATGADVQKSVDLCDRLDTRDSAEMKRGMAVLCYHGVFMQLFQPIETSDELLIKGLAPVAPEAVKPFCAQFSTDRKNACMQESWPLFTNELTTASGIASYCSYADTATERASCYEGTFYILASQFQFDEKRISTMCNGFDTELRGQCYANAATRFLETDEKLISRAVGLCAIADQNGAGERCYREVLFDSAYDFHIGSPQFNALCSALPSPWQEKCKNGDGANTIIHADPQ